MGKATIVSSQPNGHHVVRYNPRTQATTEELIAIAQSLAKLEIDIAAATEKVALKELEVENAADAVSAMIEDYAYRVQNGLDPDPPIDPVPPQEEPDDPPPYIPPDVPPVDEGSGALSGVSGGLLSRHNSTRTAAGLPTLTIDARLTSAAQAQANYLSKTDSCTHDGQGGSTPTQRIYAAGYPRGGMTGENVAAGQASLEKVMDAWMKSPGHRANILRNGWTNIGFGYAYREKATYRHYFCVTFGKP